MKSYIGSVVFYKHLLLTALTLMILGLITLVLFFGIKCAKMSESLALADEYIAASADEAVKSICEPIPYQQEYPQLYAQKPEGIISVSDIEIEQEKVIYLTFDDGPSLLTPEILDVLDEYGVKATFFVIGKEDEFSKSIYKEIVERGHTIGVHTYSHQYKEIYTSVDSYLADFNRLYQLIYDTTGVPPQIFRFPGGSVNVYNAAIYQEIIAEMLRRGFVYYDWNVSSGDTGKSPTKTSVTNNIVPKVKNFNEPVVLFHDSSNKKCVVEALPAIIEKLQQQGYCFDKLDATVPPICFVYTD
ncbi:MAG: polysaccharide deacetylase [Clostridia bacterium]|nr:polysaccharide deacetylase [Clostridia bacterium]MDD4570957.1 polysaccharide deacetylase [Clostridia bacterium]